MRSTERSAQSREASLRRVTSRARPHRLLETPGAQELDTVLEGEGGGHQWRAFGEVKGCEIPILSL